ncbi:MAG: hypothetical protein H6Q90_3752 [Deltaproteobacteria bacterium]|nr:hypothetical protein [Deltaproteobacteria bacterium]
MSGSETVRHCGTCRKDVYNLSAMTEAEADSVLTSGGDRCIRFFYRPDGTVVTSRCADGNRTSSIAAAGVAVVLAHATAFSSITVALDDPPASVTSASDGGPLLAMGGGFRLKLKEELPKRPARPRHAQLSEPVADVKPTLAPSRSDPAIELPVLAPRPEPDDRPGLTLLLSGLTGMAAAIVLLGTRRRWSPDYLRALDAWSVPQVTAVAAVMTTGAAGVSVLGGATSALACFALGLARLVMRSR